MANQLKNNYKKYQGVTNFTLVARKQNSNYVILNPLSYTKPRVTNDGYSMFEKCAPLAISETPQNMP